MLAKVWTAQLVAAQIAARTAACPAQSIEVAQPYHDHPFPWLPVVVNEQMVMQEE